MSKHKYDDEFRKQIVDIVESNVKTVKEIAGEYGLPVQTIHSWVRKYKNSSSFRDEDQLTPEQKEIRELKKKIKQIEEENEILKKATAIFSRLTK
ncbi:transposase [Cetobacterium somerae]|uniref:transposase n=1 Tax=Cetobacterium sp. NK01 TaxID=2993530 RepID=UPI002115E405|nr:transposase [Cetobacterium sp. NK01]MCQ8213308.1 transposase [Cetobacterium sp. NK01]